MKNFEAFHWNISSSINLIFLKSGRPIMYSELYRFIAKKLKSENPKRKLTYFSLLCEDPEEEMSK